MSEPQLADVSGLIKDRDDAIRAFQLGREEHAKEIEALKAEHDATLAEATARIDKAISDIQAVRHTMRAHVHEAILAWYNAQMAPHYGPVTQIQSLGKDAKGVEQKREVTNPGWLLQITPQFIADRLGALEQDLAARLGAV